MYFQTSGINISLVLPRTIIINPKHNTKNTLLQANDDIGERAAYERIVILGKKAQMTASPKMAESPFAVSLSCIS